MKDIHWIWNESVCVHENSYIERLLNQKMTFLYESGYNLRWIQKYLEMRKYGAKMKFWMSKNKWAHMYGIGQM